MSMDPITLINKAQHSEFYKRLLNLLLWRMIPFNKPHGLRVKTIDAGGAEIHLPYRKPNFNHIKGLHACALATLAEYTTGFSLLRNLGMQDYRIIMKKLQMEYFYQGKSTAIAKYSVDDQWINKNILDGISTEGFAIINCEIHINDSEGNHLATGNIHWHIKRWEDVKTKTE